MHDPDLVRIAMHLASGMVGQSGYTEHDADDLLQILIIAGTLALPRFNQAKAKRSTFIYSVLREKVIDLARHAGRAKRDRTCEAFSLDETWPEDETGETAWGEIIGEEHTLNQDGAIRADHADLRPLRADIKEVIEDLPPSLRDLCRLHFALRPEEARREAGMAKSTHHRAIAKIREFMVSRGICSPGTDSGAASDHWEGTL